MILQKYILEGLFTASPQENIKKVKNKIIEKFKNFLIQYSILDIFDNLYYDINTDEIQLEELDLNKFKIINSTINKNPIYVLNLDNLYIRSTQNIYKDNLFDIFKIESIGRNTYPIRFIINLQGSKTGIKNRVYAESFYSIDTLDFNKEPFNLFVPQKYFNNTQVWLNLTSLTPYIEKYPSYIQNLNLNNIDILNISFAQTTQFMPNCNIICNILNLYIKKQNPNDTLKYIIDDYGFFSSNIPNITANKINIYFLKNQNKDSLLVLNNTQESLKNENIINSIIYNAYQTNNYYYILINNIIPICFKQLKTSKISIKQLKNWLQKKIIELEYSMSNEKSKKFFEKIDILINLPLLKNYNIFFNIKFDSNIFSYYYSNNYFIKQINYTKNMNSYFDVFN